MKTVTFTIDIDALTDDDAAQAVIALMQRPTAWPLEFIVSDDPCDNEHARLVTVNPITRS